MSANQVFVEMFGCFVCVCVFAFLGGKFAPMRENGPNGVDLLGPFIFVF